MIPLDDESFTAFMEESKEHIDKIEEMLLGVEDVGSVDAETINSIFRSAHTIKGTAGFFAVDAVKSLAHAMENVLGLVRSEELAWSNEITAVLLEGSDLLRQMMQAMPEVERVDADDVKAMLDRIATGAPAVLPAAPVEESPAAEPVDGAAAAEVPLSVAADEPPPVSTVAPAPVPAAPAEPMFSSEEVTSIAAAPPPPPRPPPSQLAAPVEAAADEADGDGPAQKKGATQTATVRVNVTQLDRLMMLAGELVLTRNALLRKASERDLDELCDLTQRVDAITSDLQDGIMSTRMQPVGNVFNRFKRTVRDLARQLGKQLALEIEGEEVELDRSIIEAIGDPLTHLVRNAADHGIETPDRRIAAGKREAGVLKLRALHEGGQVVVEVSDDGAGIDGDRVARRAVEKGLMSAGEVAKLTPAEKLRLIFLPSLSTAEAVTDVSGRGVGMDVVLSQIQKVGGTVDVRSTLGGGSTVSLRLPLTLAIVPSLLVIAGGQRFAIPQVNVAELVRVPAGERARRLERVGTALVLPLRGELLPLVRLADLLGAADEPGSEKRPVHIVIVQTGGARYGLIVDSLLDSEEIVVKPSGSHLAGCGVYAGATILGDGAVALILDVNGISSVANLAAAKSMIDAAESRRRLGTTADSDAQTLLIVENAPGERFAVPLALVSRIDKVKESSVTRVGGRATITYGQSMLPLIAIEDVAKVTPREPADRFFVVIHKVWQREVGIMVSRIVDVVENSAPIDGVTHAQPGILGSVVIDGKVVLMLGGHRIVEQLLPDYKKAPVDIGKGASTILVVEDSPFFLKQISGCIKDGGLPTVTAGDGEAGFAALEAHADDIAAVVTDIEMPKMDGFELTRRIRSDSRFAHLPVLAVTSLSGELAERRGREAGLTEYLIKLDREQIVERLKFHLEEARARQKAAQVGNPSKASKGAAR